MLLNNRIYMEIFLSINMILLTYKKLKRSPDTQRLMKVLKDLKRLKKNFLHPQTLTSMMKQLQKLNGQVENNHSVKPNLSASLKKRQKEMSVQVLENMKKLSLIKLLNLLLYQKAEDSDHFGGISVAE